MNNQDTGANHGASASSRPPRQRRAIPGPVNQQDTPAANISNSEAIHPTGARRRPPPKRAAKATANANLVVPPALNSGAIVIENAKARPPRRRRGAIDRTSAEIDAPLVGTNSEANTTANTGTNPPPSRQREAMKRVNTTCLPPPAADALIATCLELAKLQKVRLFCIVSQSRCDRSMEAAIASALGFSVGAEKDERKAVFKRAKTIREAVEAGKPFAPPMPLGDQRSEMLSAFLPLIPISAQARMAWDTQRLGVEAEMRRLATTLPVYGWVKEHARGVGDLGLARIVGSAPLIGAYATPEKLWKRLGLAVIAGERQQRKGDKDEALMHGYAPQRRAEVWSVCSDTMFRQQWRGGEDDGPGYPIGPYGYVYQQRKAHTFPRIAATEALPKTDRQKWTKGRCENDARRVMTKEFLRDLWRVWHGLDARWPERWAEAQRAAAA